jgi:hypothetical protein
LGERVRVRGNSAAVDVPQPSPPEGERESVWLPALPTCSNPVGDGAKRTMVMTIQ